MSEGNVTPPSLREQLLRPRFWVPLLVAVGLFVLLLWRSGFDLTEVWRRLRTLSIPQYLLGLFIFLCGLPLRALRWRVVLREAHLPVDDPNERKQWASLPRLLEILWISWFVNGVLPARLGDVYRCYLFQERAKRPFSIALGMVFAERVADLLVLFGMLFLFGSIALGFRLPPELQAAFWICVGLAALLVVVLLSFRFGAGLVKRLVPSGLFEKIERFRGGVLAAFQVKSFPKVVGLTALIWLIEGARLWFVVSSLGDLSLGVSIVVFISLLGSLLTSVPALPGGLGLTEAGLTGALVFFQISKEDAFSIAMLDRFLNFWLIIAIGFVLYLRSLRRARSEEPALELKGQPERVRD